MATPADDLGDQTFWYTAWITAEGQLTAENVMEYFETSLFWDPLSTNAALKMQNQYSNVIQENTEDQLRKFTGIEFALVHAEPPDLFVIHKRHRTSPNEAHPLAAYFIMNNRIYCSPDIYSVISGRLRSSLLTLRDSLQTLRHHKPDYSPRNGHLWPVELKPVNTLGADVMLKPEAELRPITTPMRREGAEPSGQKDRMEVRPLLMSIESARRHLEQRISTSRIEVAPTEGDALHDNFNIPNAAREVADSPTRTMQTGSTNPSATAGAFTASTSTIRKTGSSNQETPRDNSPGSPSVNELGAGGAGAPGGGKKKRKRQALVAQRAAASAASASPHSSYAVP